MSAALAKPGRHEEAAGTALRDAALALYPELRDRVAEVARAVTALRAAPMDIVLMMAAADAYSLAAEALAEMAKQIHERADAAILTAIQENVGTGFSSGTHIVHTRVNPPTVEILSPEAVPEQFMVQPEPRPDRRQIARYLKSHPRANFARLVDGTVSLVRTPAR